MGNSRGSVIRASMTSSDHNLTSNSFIEWRYGVLGQALAMTDEVLYFVGE